jgi:hypothetical protein
MWDLQADRKHQYSGVDESQSGMVQFVPLGVYDVTVTMGEEKAKKKLRVLPGPDPKH